MNQLTPHSRMQTHNSQINPTMKPSFKPDVTWRCMKPSDIAYISKYKPKMLHKISINSLCSEKIGGSGLRKLRKAFQDSKWGFSASFWNPTVNAKQLTFLLDSTNHWRDLFFFSQQRPERLGQELIKAISRLGRCKKLSAFPLSIISVPQDVNGKMVTCVYQQLKKLNQLKKLGLNIPFYDNTTILNFRLPQSLMSLHLNFKDKSLVYQQQLSPFLIRLQHRCNLLEQFTLSFSQEHLIEPSDAEIWTCFFQNPPKSLKKFHITLWLSTNQQPEGVQALIQSLKHLKHLTSLSLSSFHPILANQPLPFIDSFFSLIFSSLQSLAQLEELELRFYFFKRMQNNDIQRLSSMLQCLRNLKNLSIDLPQLHCPDEGLISLSQALKHTTNLKTLDLKCSSNFSQKSVQILSNNIAHHRHLTSLCLDLYSSSGSQTPISTTSAIKQGLAKIFTFWKSNNLTPFFSDLSNFSQLSTLKLQLSAIHHSPQEWKYLSLALQRFNKLSSLHLNLPQFDSAKGFQDLHELLFCFKHLPKLTRLDLNFGGGPISDREVEIISSNIAGCQPLSTLNL